MPAQLSFFDMEVSVSPPTAYQAPFTIPLGPNWQPNDIRVVCSYFFFLQAVPGNTGAIDFSNGTLQPTPGWTSFGPVAATINTTSGTTYGVISHEGWGGVSWRRLQAGDTNYSTVPAVTGLQIYPGSFTQWATAFFTVRGVNPTYTPAINGLLGNTTPGGISTCTASSTSVPSAGTMAAWATGLVYNNGPFANTTYINPIGNSLGVPTGWTPLVATPNSGSTYYQFDNNPSSVLVAKAFSASGSTGTFTFPSGPANNPNFSIIGMFFQSAPDVSATAGNASATSAATSATFSTSTAVTVSTGSASATGTASTAFNPLAGHWISDPLTLPGTPVTGSVVRWTATQPAGTTLTVQTSINNGASWDNATLNSPVPRLATGDTTTLSVLIRVILKRTNATNPPPRVMTLEVQVSVDAGVDELVPVGHGMVDKVTTTAVGGSTGTGSITSVVSSTAVTSRGGGQTGGAGAIRVHVTDLSGSIKRNVWDMPFTLPSGMNYGAAAQAMVLNRLPSQTAFAISSTNVQTPLLVYGMQQGGDPWQDIQDLATAIGFEAFFDPSGVFVFRPVPDPSAGEAVWEFDEDSNPLVSEASRELSNEQTFNHIIVVGQSTSSSNPVTAEAFDNNPSSPTYILGPYGEVTERLTFSLVTTQDQAQATANALLLNSLGGADTVTITCVPMPALEPGDIVKINISNVNVDGNYMINSMTTSLSPADPQQLVCFRQSTS